MENKFKQYLQNEFQKIPPTKDSMVYRKELLLDLLDYAQELKIKGVENDDIIYDLSIKQLGDMDTLLKNFENNRLKDRVLEKKKLVSTIILASILGLSILFYLATSVLVQPSIWSWSWIILLGGIFASVTALLMLFMINNKTKHSKIFIKVAVYIIVTLWVIFLALLLLLVNNHIRVLDKWWVVFITLPAFLAIADLIVSLATNSKTKWINTAIDIIVFFTMSYVVLLLFFEGFSHPGWLIILAGILIAGIELGIVYGIKSKKIKKENGDSNEINEKYYTEW